MTVAADQPLLAVENLCVGFATDDGLVSAVDGVSFSVAEGRTLGLVGESGSGKSVTSLTTMGLLRSARARVSGSVRFAGRELLALDERERRTLRGSEMAMIFQDPLSALHPFYRVGWQIVEAMRAHREISSSAARAHAIELLGLVGIPDPGRRIDAYPHELSGGQRQRAMIAMALVNEPRLLIADEPTTALDVTVQAQILELLRRLQRELGMAMLFITHDLDVVAEMAHDVAVMYAGRIVEQAPTDVLFADPQHPYTGGLLSSIPRLDTPRGDALAPIAGRAPNLASPPGGCRFHPRCPHAQPEHALVEPVLEPLSDEPRHRVACLLAPDVRRRIAAQAHPRALAAPRQARDAEPALLEVRDLVKEYPGRGGLLRRRAPHRAVDGVSFTVARGETLGLVGETGCGKTTVARMIAGLLAPTSGEVRFEGVDVAACRGRRLKALRRELQVVFQDPQGSLNDRKTVGAIVAEPFVIHGLLPERRARRRRVAELIEHVGLDPSLLGRRPADLSGGQRQRVGIARALALEPKLIIADEPVSALDVSVQAQILNLLRDLQRDLGLTLVFISHDLAVVRHMSDRVVVMQAGKAVEIADADELYANPAHAYTRSLLASVPGAPRHAGTEVTDAVDR